MYEWHGWATIRTRFHAEDDLEADPDDDTVRAVRALLAAVPGHPNEVLDLRCANGDVQLWLAGLHNHAGNGVVELFHAIAAAAPGSYGLLHVYDDEDRDAPNTWSCHVMRRGTVTRHADRFLSPHVGLVEDP